jgi:glycosyltransferase involved in cell wall biosynthesis
VVANDIEEITGDLIQNKDEGTVVSGENVEAFAQAIISHLNNPEKRQRIAGTVRKKMEENFSSSQLAKRYSELFNPVRS